MTFQKNKVLTTIALILMLTMTTAMAFMPAANAANGQCQTYAFINVNPNPVGVNQHVDVNFWLSIVSPTAAQSQGDRFSGFKVTILKPDGTTETKGPFRSEDLSASYFSYSPTMAGNYTFTFNYPGETFTSVATDYLPSQASYVLNVQPEAVPNPVVDPYSPLPTNYWTRPINGVNYGWSNLGGNWLMAAWDSIGRAFDNGCAYDPFTSAPNSAHILWTKQMTFGGLVGGGYGSSAYFSGLSYEEYFKPPVIISGRLYYNTILAGDGHSVVNFTSITAVDLYTGQTLFTIPNATLSFGQIYNYAAPNEAGARAFLWEAIGTNWRMFDAWTGTYLLTMTNVPSGTITLGADGSIIIYRVALNSTTQTYQLTKWNNTMAIAHPFISATNDEWTWSLYNNYGQVINSIGNSSIRGNDGVTRNLVTNGIEYQVNLTNVPIGGAIRGTWITGALSDNNKIWVGNGTTGLLGFTGSGTIPVVITYVTNPGISFWSSYDNKGTLLSGPVKLDLNGVIPPNSTAYASANIGVGGILTLFVKETMQFYAFNLNTGERIWGPTQAYTNPWGMYDFQGGGKYIVNGILYNAGYDGIIHAFTAATGDELWEFSTGNAGTLLPYGTWPLYNGLTVADGKLFATTGDHGNGVSTLYTGEGLYAVNAVTGTEVWNMSGWFEQPAIADGLLISHNNYDNVLYAFGKGPSATTVESPLTGIVAGSSCVIQGTITDQSIGAKGTPAISDADQTEWMAYLYEQKLMPTNAKGVPVKLTAIDPNGNFQTLGTVTSDADGNFAYIYNPQLPGMYTVTATFEGSNSYYGSHATTHIVVVSAAGVTPAPTNNPTPTTSTSPTTVPSTSPSVLPTPNSGTGIGTEVYIAIAAVIIIVAIVAVAVLLRRRK
jgi:outer membrane protein assembly factor BamB